MLAYESKFINCYQKIPSGIMRPMKQKWTLVPVFVFLTKHHLNFEKHLDAQLSV